MYKRLKSYAVVLLSAMMFSQSLANGTYAASTGVSDAAVFIFDKLGSIALKSNVNVKLIDMDILEQPSGNILIYTLSYSNGSSNSVAHVDYFSRVTTNGGSVIQGKPITREVTKKIIPPNSSQIVTYYVNIGKSTRLNGTKVTLFTWDFSSQDYQKKLGVFTIPASYSAVVPQGQSKEITMENLLVNIRAESLQRLKMNGKIYMRVGVSFTNLGKKVLSDTAYKAYLKSAGGSVFDLKLENVSGSFNVQSQEKKTVYYLTEVPSYMKTEQMILQFAQEDETLKIMLPVKSFKLPAVTTSDLAVANYAVKKISIKNNTVEMQLKSASVYSENDSAKWNLEFRLKNLGNKAITLPAYELTVKAAEGFSIPVDSKALENVTLKPLEEKIINLNADVPLELNQGKLQLQWTEPSVDDKVIFPTAQFNIPYSLENNNLMGQEYTVQNRYGKFMVKLVSYQRLPWDDTDQIVTNISIRNTGLTSVQLPSLKAIVKAGMSDQSSSAQIVTTNTQTSLAPNEATEIYVIAKVPYTYSFNQLKIVLQATSGDEVTKFLSMNTSSLNNVIHTIAVGETHQMNSLSKKAKVSERRTTTYNENSSNLIYTELEMINEEPRQSKQAQLVAYYKTPDNQFFKAVVSQSITPTSPNGKNLVTIWSKLPQGVSTSDLMLYIGEGIADGKLTDLGGTSTGFINSVKLALTPNTVIPHNNLTSVDLFPYNLSVANAAGTITEEKGTLDVVVNYSLSEKEDFEAGHYEHKLVLELIDPYGQSMEKTLELGADLPMGKNKSYLASFNSNFHKILRGGSIRINLYDEFQGHRMLLGGQSYPLTYISAEPKNSNSNGSSGN
ncbi:hypothetical protein M2444_000463 [Paenibacillus sp. PastF-3]|uniref:hypothetical protein n=1 Tax=Paenibacillus sp. PastF-3 TaxID=2940626 RepID=UPI0024749321|nr:hypothetical protein [Paenibacillus sp. PastF-3]MDH6368685.1 hypothetical protein [Paenibacillus sp. PastF-3]